MACPSVACSSDVARIPIRIKILGTSEILHLVFPSDWLWIGCWTQIHSGKASDLTKAQHLMYRDLYGLA